jgi:hypothetical protein
METATASLGSLLIELVFYILLAVFVLHATVLAYHWFGYGTSKRTATIALISYLAGGAALFLILLSSTYTL